MARSRVPETLWLIDGYNVLRVSLAAPAEAGHTRDPSGRPGWWRAERRQTLLALARELPGPSRVEIVFDGDPEVDDPPSPLQPGRSGRAAVREVYAACADDWIVARLKQLEAARKELDPENRSRAEAPRVVTADRALAGRSRHHGAVVISTGRFVELCREARGGEAPNEGSLG